MQQSIVSFLIFLFLLFIQLYAAQKKWWPIAFSLPISVLVLKIIDFSSLSSPDLIFISDYASCFLVSGTITLVLALAKDRREKDLPSSSDEM